MKIIKKILLVLTAIMLLVVLGYFLMRTTLNWDDSIEALDSEITVSDIKDLEVGVHIGGLLPVNNNLKIYLNDKPLYPGQKLITQLNGFGTYKLKAIYRNHRITKKFNLIKDSEGLNPIDQTTSLLLDHSEYYYEQLDSDEDGISDSEELNIYESDPYDNDTDDDGYWDISEIALGLDILDKDDIRVKRTFSIQDDTYHLTLSGIGNIANVFVDKVHVKELEQNQFIVGDILEITTDLRFGDQPMSSCITFATLAFAIDPSVSTDDLGVFAYDRKEGELVWLSTEIDREKNTITVPISAPSIYGIGHMNIKPDEIKTEIALVIDNSGSMFSVDYVEKAQGSEISDDGTDAYGRDIAFNRLSLMTSLVDRLSGKKYRFSVGAFQSLYNKVNGMIEQTDTLKESISRLKTEYQDFNGTSIETAIHDGLYEFSKNSFNKKYIILLTDGYSNESWIYLAPSIESVIDEANRLQVEIITIGLGDCDENLLKRIANETGGIYLHAKDSDVLQTLTDRILSSMKELEIDRDGNGIIDTQMIADSGFKAEVDGFPFSNFGDSSAPGGNCYGFSITSKLIYEDVLPKEMEETKIRGITPDLTGSDKYLPAYKMDETSIKLLESNNTYDIHVPTLFLINDPIPDDFREVEGNTYKISPKYRDRLLETGYKIFVIKNETEVDGKIVKLMETEGRSFDAYSKKAMQNVPPSELDFIHIINRNQNAQMDLIISRRMGAQFTGIENTQTKEKLINQIAEELESGRPALVGIHCSLGGHAVLVTSMSYDITDSNKIFLTIYDSNVPGTNGIGFLERTKSVDNGTLYDKYIFRYSGAGLDFNTILFDEVELLNGDTVFYSQK